MKKYKDAIFAVIMVVVAVAGTIPFIMNKHIPPEPKSNIWQKFKQCNVDKHYLEMKYSIDYTEEVKALNGKQITLDGYIIPLEATDKFQHFLLSVRSSSCQFCPPGSENEMVEVFSDQPISWSDGLVTISGTLKLAEQKNETGIFFQLINANLGQLENNSPAIKGAQPIVKNYYEYNFTEYNPKTNIYGADVSTKNWKGKNSIILFWRSDCAPCLEEIKLLPEIAANNTDSAIRVIAINEEINLKKYLKEFPDNVSYYISKNDNRELLKAFGNERVIALPYSVVLDKKGNIHDKHYGILSPIKKWKK